MNIRPRSDPFQPSFAAHASLQQQESASSSLHAWRSPPQIIPLALRASQVSLDETAQLKWYAPQQF